MEYIISTYGVIKDTNPLLKESLQKSEDAAVWVKQKAEDMIVATKLDQPLKQLDAVATRSFEKIEETKEQIRSSIEASNNQLQDRMKNVSTQIKKNSDAVQMYILENIQNVLDYMEETFEPVMLPPSDEAAMLSNDLAILSTINRIMDVTYRLNMGTVHFVGDKIGTTMEKSFINPTQILARIQTLKQEIMTRSSRFVTEGAAYTTDVVRSGTSRLTEMTSTTLTYSQNIFRDLRDANNLKDVSGITLREGIRTLRLLQENWQSLGNSDYINNLINWMNEKEKTL